MKQLLTAVAAFLVLAAFTATGAEAKATGKGPSRTTTSRTVVDPASGEKFTIVIMKKHFTSKQAALKGKPATKSKHVMKKTFLGWQWKIARCANGAYRWWQQWFFLPGWYRAGMAVFGCVLG
jgi:hypothetical protein